MVRLAVLGLLVLLLAGCAGPELQPAMWIADGPIVLQVPGDGAYFPASRVCKPILVVRDIGDAQVVPHEAGHLIWDATKQPQKYP